MVVETLESRRVLAGFGYGAIAGSAQDIGVGADGSVWVIGTNRVDGNGYEIFRRSGSGWQQVQGAAARIAVEPNGSAWIVNEQGGIWRYNGSTWDPVAGSARDIGVGADGSVWVIGTNRVDANGYEIYRRSASSWQKVQGAATRIAVDPSGNAWVVNEVGQILRWTGSGWTQLPGAARDIGVGPEGTTWVVGVNPVPGGYGCWKWGGAGWEFSFGGAAQIAVGPAGHPWAVNDAGAIFFGPGIATDNLVLPPVSASTEPIATPPGALILPVIDNTTVSNAAPIVGVGTAITINGGGTLDQSGAINPWALIISPYAAPQGGTNLTGNTEVPTVLNLLAEATITAPGGVTVDGILGLSTGNVVTADTPVTVTSKGRLRGAGTVAGTLSVSGVVAPAGNAAATAPHGQLKIGQLTLGTGSRLELQVAGPTAGTDHDQVVVTGGAGIDGALLSLDASYAPRGGAAIVLIDNRGSGPVGGTFRAPSGNPLPEGATVVANLGGTGRAGRISYQGGDGNDVCLKLDNAAPTAVALAAAGVAENQPAGTVVGTLSTTDPDAGETFVYTIVPDANLDGTGLFEIVGNQLRTKGPLDFESRSGYSVRVRSTDENGLFTGRVLSVAVTDDNDAPTEVTLSATAVVRNRPAGTVVGTFATVDQDAGDTFTYTLVPDPNVDGTGLFEIVGNQLRTKAAFASNARASYSIRVRSTDAGGRHTGTVLSISVTPPGPPVAATNVVGTPGVGQVTLSWTAPASDGGAVVRDYVVQYSGNGGGTWSAGISTGSTSGAYTVTGLVNGTSYLFRVLAKNTLGTGLPSAASAAVTPRTLPGAPVRLVAAAQNGAASLTWTPPASTGGAAITDYLVEYSGNAGTTWRAFADTLSATPSTLVTGLTNGVAYVFRVRAVNAAGRGAFSLKSAAIRPRA